VNAKKVTKSKKKIKVKIADAKSWDLILKPFTDRK